MKIYLLIIATSSSVLAETFEQWLLENQDDIRNHVFKNYKSLKMSKNYVQNVTKKIAHQPMVCLGLDIVILPYLLLFVCCIIF